MLEEIIPTPEEERLMAMDDKIDRYIKGQMTKEESAQFLSDCQADLELRHRAIAIAYLVKGLKK